MLDSQFWKVTQIFGPFFSPSCCVGVMSLWHHVACQKAFDICNKYKILPEYNDVAYLEQFDVT